MAEQIRDASVERHFVLFSGRQVFCSCHNLHWLVLTFELCLLLENNMSRLLFRVCLNMRFEPLRGYLLHLICVGSRDH